MIRPVGPHHLAHPREILVTIWIVGDKAALPGVHLLESWVEFTVQKRFFIVKVALDLIHRGLRSVNDVVNAALLLTWKPGHVDRGSESETLEDAAHLPGALTLL